jgi:hypothetical protein
MVVVAVGTLAVLCMNFREASRMKKTDVFMECSRRYDSLVAVRDNLAVAKLNSKAYFERFWMLQVDQYNHWRRGYIEDHVYRLWLYDRHAEFMANHSIGGVPYRAGWETAKATTIRDKAFLDHMTYVSDGQIDKR